METISFSPVASPSFLEASFERRRRFVREKRFFHFPRFSLLILLLHQQNNKLLK